MKLKSFLKGPYDQWGKGLFRGVGMNGLQLESKCSAIKMLRLLHGTIGCIKRNECTNLLEETYE